MKSVVGGIAIALTFIGYAPYIRDTLAGKTKPHAYSWFVWGLVSAVAFALQISDNAGFGAAVTLAAAVVCFVIFGLSLRIGEREVTAIDTACLILSLVAIAAWVFADSPVTAVVLVSVADMLGFGPTIRKSWALPHQETLMSYVLNTVRFCLALYALQRYTLVTTLYPLTWVFANGLFSVFLILRRRTVGPPPILTGANETP